jgi:hypothetical protein
VVGIGDSHTFDRLFVVAKLARADGSEIWRHTARSPSELDASAWGVAVDSLGDVFAGGRIGWETGSFARATQAQALVGRPEGTPLRCRRARRSDRERRDARDSEPEHRGVRIRRPSCLAVGDEGQQGLRLPGRVTRRRPMQVRVAQGGPQARGVVLRAADRLHPGRACPGCARGPAEHRPGPVLHELRRQRERGLDLFRLAQGLFQGQGCGRARLLPVLRSVERRAGGRGPGRPSFRFRPGGRESDNERGVRGAGCGRWGRPAQSFHRGRSWSGGSIPTFVIRTVCFTSRPR